MWGPTRVRSQPHEHDTERVGELPFYKVGDMNSIGNEIWMSRAKNYVSSSIATELGARIYEKETLIFPKIGAAIGTNKKRLLSRDSCFDNNVIGIKPIDSKLSSIFLYSLFNELDLMQFAQPGNPPSIRKSTLENVKIIYPPLSKQLVFAARATDIWKNNFKMTKARNRMDALFSSLQHRAFSGQL